MTLREKPKSYRVTWVIELDAESSVEAAELALKIQRDTGSIATVFEVQMITGPSCRVDLNLDCPIFGVSMQGRPACACGCKDIGALGVCNNCGGRVWCQPC